MKFVAVLAIGVVGVLVLVMTIGSQRPSVSEASSVLRQASISGTPIQYEIGPSGEVYFHYNSSSAAQVRAIANAMTDASRQIAQSGKPFEAEIVFAHPIPVDEYNSFMRANGLVPQSTELEGDRAGGWVGYHAPAAADGTAIDTQHLTQFLRGGDKIVGAVTASGVTLDAASFAKVAGDERVFAVTSLRADISNQVAAEYPGIDTQKMFVQPSLLYYAMQKTGIAP